MVRTLSSAVVALLLLPQPAFAIDPPHVWAEQWLPGARLGVEVQRMTPELREYFGVDASRGVLVARVEPESPAAEAGIEPGDVILEADGKAIQSPRELVRILRRSPEGEKLAILLSRRGQEKRLQVTPEAGPRPPHWEWKQQLGPWMGEALRELRQQIRTLEERLRELEKQVDPPTGTGQT